MADTVVMEIAALAEAAALAVAYHDYCSAADIIRTTVLAALQRCKRLVFGLATVTTIAASKVEPAVTAVDATVVVGC